MMTRLDFLKSAGFTGPALMALLTSCVNNEDTVVDALSLQAEVLPTTPVSTTDSSGTTTASTVKLVSPTAITSEALIKLTGVKLRIDLTLAANAALLAVRGYLVQNGMVVAQSSAGVIVAATQTCSHEPKRNVIFNKTEFYCTKHGARFSLTGAGLNNFGSGGLTIYKTATDGNTVIVY
ncbi:Rieske 2Fe-2S domain-containing protein [Dyadobacter sp. 3J3]|uniref:Rieske 2Fe-2S domain-containing protein n=1 Tax=Dyadobacter sp. 3J3 TaxID=2606600 RepID=UPI00286D75ED|nr:Rieske 2Fe-2S domain-containing protein [Dyadobacter sp. 3J3]